MASIIRSFSRIELQRILDKSTSISSALRNIGLQPKGYNAKTLKKVIGEWQLSIVKLKQNYEKMKLERAKKLADKIKFLDSEVFIKNSSYARRHIKKRIIKDNLLEHICFKCGNTGEWENEKLVLQLEHKNGISNDHRLENLCFLCPNCHSQTKNFCGRNSKKFDAKHKRELEKEQLIKERLELLNNVDLLKFGWVQKVSKLWNVSHSQVRRWIKIYYPELHYFERGI